MSTILLPDTETREDVRLSTEDGDHDLFSHYVPKAEIVRAAVDGTPARAICGKVWTPTKDGERFPVCPDCKYLHENVVQP